MFILHGEKRENSNVENLTIKFTNNNQQPSTPNELQFYFVILGVEGEVIDVYDDVYEKPFRNLRSYYTIRYPFIL